MIHVIHPCTKQVQLTENEIRSLCHASREVFMSQPTLLELEAPIKICGTDKIRERRRERGHTPIFCKLLLQHLLVIDISIYIVCDLCRRHSWAIFRPAASI